MVDLARARAALRLFPGDEASNFVAGCFAVTDDLRKGAQWMLFQDGDPVVTAERTLIEAVPESIALKDVHAIGRLGECAVLVGEIASGVSLPDGWLSENIRPLALRATPLVWAVASYGSQILHWAKTNRFCGVCAGTMEQRDAAHRSVMCAKCGHSVWPRIAPCTITLIHRGTEILMTRQSFWPPERYGLVAGFLEPGETLEECVRRETMEETGIAVGAITYMASQPWPFPHQVMVGFFAEYAGGEIALRDGELEDARWFDVKAMPKLPPKLSIARSLVDAFVEAMT